MDNPNKSVGSRPWAELLGLERAFQTFMVRSVFGTTGNPFRHGSASDGERRQVLFGVAALSGWLRSSRMCPRWRCSPLGWGELPAAVERARPPAGLRSTR